MQTKIRTFLAVGGAVVALSAGGIGIASASNGADDGPGRHHEHRGQAHHRHRGHDDSARHRRARSHGVIGQRRLVRDDHGRGVEPGDDNAGHGLEPGDDNGGHGLEPGDDHGTGVEPGDDNGGRGEVEAGDDHGGHGSEPGDDHGTDG